VLSHYYYFITTEPPIIENATHSGTGTDHTRFIPPVCPPPVIKRCDYCGKDNDAILPACLGCGTPFPKPAAALDQDMPASAVARPKLNGLTATGILILNFAGQTIGAMIAASILIILAHVNGVDITDHDQTTHIVRENAPSTTVAAVAAGIVAMFGGSLLLGRAALKDGTPVGAAWLMGPRKEIIRGFALGFIIALAGAIITTPLARFMGPKLGPLTTMGLTQGLPQITYIILAVLIVPIPEELLFRGVMYGGYRQSLGAKKAAVLTTVIFVAMHLLELSHFPPAAIGITALAIGALHMRLRSSAIGPAVAVHTGYNLVVALLTVLYTLARAK
jgi:membrane protease YdiL (CAAX protease family)